MVLAIEWDGATYQSSNTARERDRLGQEHLSGLAGSSTASGARTDSFIGVGRVEGNPKQGLRFRRPNGELIEPLPPPHGPHDGDLAKDNERAGTEIGPQTCVTDWCGDTMDYPYVVDLLVRSDERFRPPT